MSNEDQFDNAQLRQHHHEQRKHLSVEHLLNELVGAVEQLSHNVRKGQEQTAEGLAFIATGIAHAGGAEQVSNAITEGLAAVVAQLSVLTQPPVLPGPQTGRFKLILKNDTPDFGYEFDISGVTDAEGEPIVDPAALAAVVKEVTSDNTSVVSATAPDADGKGTIHVGTSGAATLSGKAWLNQADKDAGKDPAIVAAEPFTITTGDPAAITEAHFGFDIESGGTQV